MYYFINLFYKNRISHIINGTILQIKKGKGFNFNINRINYNEEFNILSGCIDNDPKHHEYLDKDTSHKYLCRYSDISTYNYNKVEINTRSTYINASWIDIPTPRNIICTQGPLPNTIDDFWTMVEQYNVNIIVMLCNIIECNSKKCENYWNIDGKKNYMKKFKITNLKEVKFDNGIILRELMLVNVETRNQKQVKQLHFVGWPDKGIPNISESFETFLNMIKYI